MAMIWKMMVVDGQDWSGVASGGHRSWPDPRKGFLPPPPCDLLRAESQSEHCSSWSEGTDAFVNAENVEDALVMMSLGRVLTRCNSKSFLIKIFSSKYSWPGRKETTVCSYLKSSPIPSIIIFIMIIKRETKNDAKFDWEEPPSCSRHPGPLWGLAARALVCKPSLFVLATDVNSVY